LPVAQGNYAEAGPLYKRSLAIREKALGPEHPDVAMSLNNLAELFRAQVRTAFGNSISSKCLMSLFETALDTLPSCSTVDGWPLTYADQLPDGRGNYAEAGQLSERSLAIREKALDQEHPSVAEPLNNLALL
ncbi:unnamed protein product, partial [Laminaria digitata]